MKSLTASFLVVLALVLSPPAEANVLLSVTYTGDNVIGAWFQDGGAPVAQTPGPNAANWQLADTATLDLPVGSYQVIFRVANIGTGGSGNPAAFLAEVSGLGVSGNLLTSTSWEWASASGADPSDFNALTWSAATSYGTNGGANIWTSVNGGAAVSGISTSAEWIWNGVNFTSSMDSELYLRGQFEVVPEPSTLMLLGLGFGFSGLGLLRRRRR